MLIFKIKAAKRQDIYQHLHKVNQLFIPPLENRVDIEKFSDKIFDTAVTFEAWEDEKLVALISSYFNNMVDNYGFINNISVEEQYATQGIATSLMKSCIEYGRNNHFKVLGLEVCSHNIKAIRLYEKFDFKIIESNDDFFKMEKKL